MFLAIIKCRYRQETSNSINWESNCRNILVYINNNIKCSASSLEIQLVSSNY
jgi:hypothetical protein